MTFLLIVRVVCCRCCDHWAGERAISSAPQTPENGLARQTEQVSRKNRSRCSFVVAERYADKKSRLCCCRGDFCFDDTVKYILWK